VTTAQLQMSSNRSVSPGSSPKAKRHKRMMESTTENQESEISLAVDNPIVDDNMDPDQDRLETEGEPDAMGDPDAGFGGFVSNVEPQLLPVVKYEYLDHTADVQIHAWGDNLEEAFEQCAMGMFGYITDIERVDNFGSERIEASGHDMLSLLFGFLDEWLFVFNADPYFVARKISITSFDRENFKISAIGYGETFNLSKHTQGTEVKAITYSNMQFHENDGYAEVFVIIDI